ncbi:MAG: RNA methyltransferase [Acidobacteria bacterium]|nr:RNA methyltransferase [Acidobacteriota bacterium]
MQKITSRSNEKVKLLRSVRDGREPGLVFIEGQRLVEEALKAGVRVRLAAISSDTVDREDERLLSVLTSGIADEIIEIPRSLFDQIGDTASPQGIILIGEKPPQGPSQILQALNGGKFDIPVIVYLHRINNPANLGAVIRTAEAAGAVGVVTSSGSADAFSPKALRGSMGSAFRLPVWEKAEFADIERFCKDNALKIVATTPAGAKDHREIGWNGPILLAFGPEADGLPDEMLESADERVAIKMRPPVESLNLAISCGIILFEARRTRDGY